VLTVLRSRLLKNARTTRKKFKVDAIILYRLETDAKARFVHAECL